MPTFFQGRTSDSVAISVEYDDRVFREEQRRILGEDLPFAAAQAMTWLVKDMQKEGERELKTRFDRPKRWTTNSLFTETAKKADYPNLTAAVYFKDEAPKGVPAGRYLHPSIIGRARTHKGFEKALIRAGHMKANEFAVPGKKVRLDSYGNVSVGLIKRMLSQLKAGNAEQYETQTSREARRNARTGRLSGDRFFIAPDTSVLPRGVYSRSGKGSPVLVFLFVKDTPDYKVRLPFNDINRRIAKAKAGRLWQLSFDQVVGARRNRRLASAGKAAGLFASSLL